MDDAAGWRGALRRLVSQVWWRLTLFTVLAVALVVVAGLVGRRLPESWAVDFGQDSVATILQILATSMLAVTTFSLTAMITTYASAASVATPRATQLLIADPTSQNALSSFLGSFTFSIVGIVALQWGYFGPQGRTILFVGALIVIAVVVITLLRWIQHLTGFGRMADVIDRVERAATDTVVAYAERPHLGGRAPVVLGRDARPDPIRAPAPGCVTGLDVAALDALAADRGWRVHVRALPGAAVARGDVLAVVEPTAGREATDHERARIVAAFRLEAHRTFEQDPRLGMVALGETASRALSPAVNDPGTAIETLNAVQRVLTRLLTTEPERAVRFTRVHVPALELRDLVEDALRPIARDGAAFVEVDLRLQKVIEGLLPHATGDDSEVLQEAARRAATRALAALRDSHDRSEVEGALARATGSGEG